MAITKCGVHQTPTFLVNSDWIKLPVLLDMKSISTPRMDKMETTLHRQLKEAFARPGSQFEKKVGSFRIDVVSRGKLIEIQHSGLSSIRTKVLTLLENYRVDVVKPLVIRKRLIKLDAKDGEVIDERWSNRRGSKWDLFAELVYFTQVFPHPKLRLIVPLVEIEEIRFPGHGRRRRWRAADFQVADRRLVKWHGCDNYVRSRDLCRLLPKGLPTQFDTKQLSEGLGIPRSTAQQMAFVLRATGAIDALGKNGNSWLYKKAA